MPLYVPNPPDYMQLAFERDFVRRIVTEAPAIAVPPNTGLCLNPEEAELVRLVNEYRVQNGLPALPASKWLSTVGQYHAWDVVSNNPVGGSCNLHSWSNSPPPGVTWQGMCYTPDHAQAAQMWGKPRQISGNVYTGNGYENAAVAGGPMNAVTALQAWQFSPAHNAVILQTGVWAGVNFQGLGVGIVGNIGVLWFGDGANNGGLISECVAAENLFADGFE